MKKINLGGEQKYDYNYTTVGYGQDIDIDITKKIPLEPESIDFIWSERVLEHIKTENIINVFINLRKILKKGGIVRLCLPICFYVDDKSINMMRLKNYQKQVDMGHVTWFTYEGFGEIREDLFGLKKSPKPTVTSKEFFKSIGFEYKLIRWFDENDKLYIDESIYKDNKFLDFPEVEIRRKNSLIFDCIKL